MRQSVVRCRRHLGLGLLLLGTLGCGFEPLSAEPEIAVESEVIVEPGVIAESEVIVEPEVIVESGTTAVSGEAIVGTPTTQSEALLWSGDWSASDWQDDWQIRSDGSWGFENLEVVVEPETASADPTPFLRVHYPAGSATPSVARTHNVARGGAQYYADLNLPSYERLRLRYQVRFSNNFDFVRGGKLPGLFGGNGASGGNIPNGTDGFSARLMWREDGNGEVYAYLPTSENFGTSIGRGNWQFRPGEWMTVEQEVILNQPGIADGRIRLWIDDALVVDASGLVFRTVDTLRIDGIFFSTFFGGNDLSWATPQDVYVDFADFTIHASEAGALHN
ncbi:MAG: polysaccharide lyase [Cyanobacteria bacterium J06638_22]